MPFTGALLQTANNLPDVSEGASAGMLSAGFASRKGEAPGPVRWGPGLTNKPVLARVLYVILCVDAAYNI